MDDTRDDISDQPLQPCGPYRTTRELPDAALTSGLLVYFHSHSDEGPPIVLLPESNTHNRWRFHPKGHLVSASYAATLEPLKPEGLYRLREHFHPDNARVVAANALVQLGYNREAEPLIFYPKPVEGENAIAFPSRGMKIPAAVYELLEPLDTRGPHQPTKLH